jgi:hypothetical protein
MTLTMASTHITHVRSQALTDPQAYHRREALALFRSRRRARRRMRTAMLQSALRAAAAPLASSSR